jgi:hypothetical protein
MDETKRFTAYQAETEQTNPLPNRASLLLSTPKR